MTPFNEYRKSYITVSFSIAVIYAFALGGNLSLIARPADAAIYGGLLYLMGIILWNIFKFALPAHYTLKYQLMFLAGLAVPVCLFTTATESFAIYLLFPSQFDSFVYSIPARLFITLLLFILIRLFYLAYYAKSKTPENNPDVFYTAGNPDFTATDADAFYTKTDLPDSTRESTIPPVTNTDARQMAVAAIDPPPSNRITANPLPSDRITVRTGQRIKIIPIEDIIYIKADGDYISIKTSDGNWLKEQTMKYTEDMLPADRFVRIHRSYIVNVNHISRIERYGEKQQVELHNNEKIKISPARYQTLRQILGF
jgi:hypothetical protein